MERYKRYIDVELLQQKDGNIIPLSLVWNDGRKFNIDKVISKEKRISSVGGCGMRFT